jgi:CRISPR-associated endonuclease/helicase Cas3
MNNKLQLAKPSGISIEEHTENVLNETISIIHAHPYVIKKYSQLVEKDLVSRLRAAAKYHDDGKKHPKWQNACLKEYEIFLQTKQINGSYLQKTGIRHEMESLYLHKDHKFSDPIKVAIAAHHSKLGNKYETRWEKDNNGIYKELWIYFKRLNYSYSIDLESSLRFPICILKNYEFSGVRSFLQLADHRASIKEDFKFIPEFNKFDYKFNPDWTKRPVQKIAEDNWQDEILLLRAPTGAGKTDACLLWANKQIENNRADRLVIAMPTRFTSNALAINVAESLSETGLYHSSSWFVNYFDLARQSNDAEHKAKLQHEFARLLETPVTVCTIDHLLISLTHSREDHHSITFNLANSCLVIDEADFYDEFTQANILELLKVLKILKVPVLLMSASLPQSTLQLYKKTGFQINEIKEDISDNKRIRCEIISIREYENIQDLSVIIEKTKKQPTIIYANTIAKAMEFYDSYSEEEKKNITLYHSRFTEPDKMIKESKLLEKLGKKAWENNKANGIAIMTQIGEMSVNISSNYMLSEICPFDRLIQRLGRLSRFDRSIGIVDILIPIKDGKIYPAPYGNYILNKGWEINKALEDTIKNLTCKQFNSFELVELVNKVYPEMSDFTNRTQSNAKRLKDQIIQNWLILPYAQTDEDEENTHIWKSRDIEPQSEVYVLNPINYLDNNFQKYAKIDRNKDKFCYFDNFKEFMYFKNQYSVSCPLYLLKKGLKSGQVYKSDNIWIGDNREPKHIWITDNYTSELGLILNDNDETKIIDKC